MAARKYSASMDDTLLAAARTEAAAEGTTLSRWLADAAADRLRLKGLRQAVDDWESEHGPITEDELAAVAKKVASARRRAATRARRPLAS